MTQFMSIGDIAVTSKPIANVARGSIVHIIKAEIHRDKVHYSSAVFKPDGEFQTFIGPIQENAFIFRRNGTPQEISDLLSLVQNGGPKTLGADGQRHPWSCTCDWCTNL